MRDTRLPQPDRLARGRVPWFVFGVTLLLSGVAAWYVNHSNRARADLQFTGFVDSVRDAAADNLSKYITALRGTAALFDTFGVVSSSQFHTFVSHLDVHQHYPGIRVIGFAPRVSQADLSAFLASATAEIPNYAVWPFTPGRDEYLPVRYQEPYYPDRHAAMGHDVQTDPARAAALQRACDTGSPAMTGKLELAQPIGPGPDHGFIIFVPLYQGGGVPPTILQRRDRLIGYAFGAFSSEEFFRSVLDPAAHEEVSFQIFSGVPAKQSLLYDTASHASAVGGFIPRFHTTVSTPVLAGQSWTMQAFDRQGFDATLDDRLPALIFLGGAGISFVLFAVTRGLASAQAQAERNAGELLIAGRALRATQTRLRRLVESNLIGVFFCDPAGQITDANDEFLRITGLSRPDLQSRAITVASLTPPQFHLADEAALSKLKTAGVGPSYEKELLRPDGSRVPVLIGMALVDAEDPAALPPGSFAEPAARGVGPSPSASAVVAFTIDITQRHLAERELRHAKEVAEKANRSKDQFLAVLSHELRTPLTPVLAIAAVSQADDQLSADTRDTFAMIHRNVELEARLIDDLLDLTRVARGKLQLHMTDVDLHEVLTHAAEVCDAEELTTRRLTLRQHFQAGEHHVHGDAARLQQVFWNLVKNAVKFTPAGGTITLSTRTEPAGSPFGGSDRPVIAVDVTDTGIGIEPEVLSKVFDAFEQGSAARAEASGGLGLGLAISRGLVAGHGGVIAASSAGRDRGATFTVRLHTTPAPAPAQVLSSPVPAAPIPAPASAGLDILLVEDHLDTAKVMSRLLRSGGHRVRLAHSVADALQQGNDAPFDLLISDLGLPDGSGLDVIHGLRLNPAYAATPAIALTGYGTDDDIRRSMAAGFTDHLTKPINFDTLRSTIARVLAKQMLVANANNATAVHQGDLEPRARPTPGMTLNQT